MEAGGRAGAMIDGTGVRRLRTPTHLIYAAYHSATAHVVLEPTHPRKLTCCFHRCVPCAGHTQDQITHNLGIIFFRPDFLPNKGGTKHTHNRKSWRYENNSSRFFHRQMHRSAIAPSSRCRGNRFKTIVRGIRVCCRKCCAGSYGR